MNGPLCLVVRQVAYTEDCPLFLTKPGFHSRISLAPDEIFMHEYFLDKIGCPTKVFDTCFDTSSSQSENFIDQVQQFEVRTIYVSDLNVRKLDRDVPGVRQIKRILKIGLQWKEMPGVSLFQPFQDLP